MVIRFYLIVAKRLQYLWTSLALFKSRRDHFFVNVHFKSKEIFNFRVEISLLIVLDFDSHWEKLENVAFLTLRTRKRKRITTWVVLMGRHPWFIWGKSEFIPR